MCIHERRGKTKLECKHFLKCYKKKQLLQTTRDILNFPSFSRHLEDEDGKFYKIFFKRKTLL